MLRYFLLIPFLGIIFVPSVFAEESQNEPLTLFANSDYFLFDQTLLIYGTGLPGDTLAVRMIAPDGHFAMMLDQVKTDPNDGSYDVALMKWSEITQEFPKGKYKVEAISTEHPDISKSVFVNRILKEDLFSGTVDLKPLHQTEIGILPENIFCDKNMRLILKNHDESPACVTVDSAEKILQRGGWKDVPSEKVVRWMKSEYTTNGNAILQITDSQIKWLDSEKVNNFSVRVWSDSDPKGIDLTMTETGKTTGLFKGTVFFDTDESSGHRLKISSGDNVFAKYDSITKNTSIT